MPIDLADFSRDMENPSPNLSPTRREALISPPSLVGKQGGFIQTEKNNNDL
ncbi:hypothetical protein NSTC731_01692 [Nostoc sp. DSM 114167]|jgi:hypothetical protein